MDKNLRIHTNIANDTILNVNMQQDYDFLEVLTMKLRQKDAYKLHSSNYGVIIGRVLANDAFGIPNARISVFVARDNDDASYLESIYPYSEVTSKDKEGRRYNLLPDYSDDECYRIVGTFPNKRLVLDVDTYLEVYDKYWKYSTVTNNAGDYMIFGVPTGNQQIHVDLDLSDIGILSQKPRDFEYKGYNLTMFDNPNQFKESTNLDSLAQLFSQNKSVFVYPFWGDEDNGVAAITRSDIQIQYKFEPTCVFMGSIVSDNEGNAIGHKCAAEVDNGMNNQLIAGEGTIEMIRKTQDGLVEEYQIQGNQLINENGVWCYQIPMNLDFVGTDEYGNIVPTDNPNKGIPTRTQVRFRFSKNETGDEGFSRHTAKYLVPMNPIFAEHNTRVDGATQDGVVPVIGISGQEVERMYTFGSSTPDSCFRDLYWNNVYSVKNYIPKVQVAHRPYSKNYSALKGSNLVDDQNPIPFNKLRVDIPFMYMIVCILFTVVMWIVSIINLMICMINKIFSIFNIIHNIRIPVIRVRPFSWIPAIPYIGCLSLGGGLSEDNTAFYPGCDCKEGLNAASCPEDMEGNCKKRASKGELMDRVQRKLAEDYKIIKLDLYQDWLNGCLYMPLWHWRKRKKKTFLFFTLSRAKNEYCSCDRQYSRLKTYVTCNVDYKNDSLEVDDSRVPEREDSWHRSKGRAQQVRYKNGVIKEVENNDGLKTYYYTAIQATTDNRDPNLAMDKRTSPFYAIRLYATDIILLGNLNENNLYGIPQFFKTLPSTTANIPPIATIEESAEDDEDVNEYSENEVAGGEDSGTSITTGMDWGRDGDEDTPQYKNGLFMDLACTYADTKAKSCFNVERLSELGVNLDMTYNMSYSHRGNNIETGLIDSDGFITKYELDDMENRAMFATMNHIGFVPQAYQDTISGHTTQVEDENTGYLIPKFKYIYPVDFDGRMQILMDRYKGNFEQAMFDDTDEAYLTFRFGAESSDIDRDYTEHERLRHFYYARNSHYEMPLYNNSFYFYFGIKKGSTAIDKFNELFYSECFQNTKKPFALNVERLGTSYCPSLYDCHRTQRWVEDDSEARGHWENYQGGITNDRGYGYIRVTSDDIRVPFSYTLYDSNDVEVISESGMTETDFVIGGTIDEETGEIIHNEHGRVLYQISGEQVSNKYGASGLTNQTYTLIVRDANGKSISERVKLEMDKVSFDYVAQRLGTKFYNTDVTRIDYICNDENQFYGRLNVTRYFIDSYEYQITAASCSIEDADSEKYVVYVTGTTVNPSAPVCNSVVVFELYALNEDSSTDPNVNPSVRDCMCDKGNSIPNRASIKVNPHDAPNTDYFYFNSTAHTFVFYVYQPSSFVGKLTQMCNGVYLSENSTTEIIKIQNGENFNAYLNTMPTRFIIGTTSDGRNAEIGNTSKFYNSNYGTSVPNGNGLSGWFGAHQETTYQFSLPINVTIPRNRDIWSDFLTIGSDITNVDTRKNILRYKFDKMFRVCDTAYLTSSNNNTFRYTATGGVEPILYRSVVPYYTKYNLMLTNYLYSDNNYVSSVEDVPQVVGINYYEEGKDGPYTKGDSTPSPRINRLYTDNEYLGNYFAAFTKNGRYTASTDGDCTISIMQLPNYAPVNPNGGWKRLGREQQLGAVPEPARTTYNRDGDCGGKVTQPYLRTLFVDRRLDYDLIVWGPNRGVDMKLHSKVDGKDKERPWKCARISGWTYGGIEMSFDEEENIISAMSSVYYTISGDEENIPYPTRQAAIDAAKVKYPEMTDEEIEEIVGENISSSATTNTRLEYSYHVNGVENENAYTVYNEPNPNNIIWVDRKDTSATKLYNKPAGADVSETKQYLKTLYEAYINDVDIRELFWSTFNETRLNDYVQNYQHVTTDDFEISLPSSYADADWAKKEFFLFPHTNADGFNGDFNYNNRDEYPSKRLIDIGNLRPEEGYYFTLTSCGYGINPEVTDDGLVKCYAEGGENVEFDLQFSNPVEFIPPNADNKDYGNAIMVKGGDEDTYKIFTVTHIDLDFRLNKVSSNDFDVYTERPLVIRVLDNDKFRESGGYKTDGITYLKSSSKTLYSNVEMPFTSTNIGSINGRLGELLLYEFRFCNVRSWLKGLEDTFPSNEAVDIWWQPGSYPFYTKDGYGEGWVTSDDNDFYNIEFRKTISISGLYAFTILVLRTYKGSDSDYLTRRIRTIETSSIYDTRRILLKVAETVTDPENPTASLKATYVYKFSGGTPVDLSGTTSTNVPDPPEEEGGEGTDHEYSGTAEVSGDVETQTHVQIITFQMLNKSGGLPEEMTNQAFFDYDMMAFTFKFTDGYGNSYYLTPEVSLDGSTTETLGKINFKLIFSQDMGILADKQWSSGARVTVFAKTKDNFTYKLETFTLSRVSYINSSGDYDSDNKHSDDDSVQVFDNTENTKYTTKDTNGQFIKIE